MGSCVWSRPVLWSSILPVSHKRWQWYYVVAGPKLPDHCQKIPLLDWPLHRSSSCSPQDQLQTKTHTFLYQLSLLFFDCFQLIKLRPNQISEWIYLLKDLPIGLFSSSSLRTSLVPRQSALLNLFTACTKSLSSVSTPSKSCVTRASVPFSTARYGPSGHPLILRALSHCGNMTCTQTNIFPYESTYKSAEIATPHDQKLQSSLCIVHPELDWNPSGTLRTRQKNRHQYTWLIIYGY